MCVTQDAASYDPDGRPRTRVVVLGSGWGAINFLRHLDPKLTSCECPPYFADSDMTYHIIECKTLPNAERACSLYTASQAHNADEATPAFLIVYLPH